MACFDSRVELSNTRLAVLEIKGMVISFEIVDDKAGEVGFAKGKFVVEEGLCDVE